MWKISGLLKTWLFVRDHFKRDKWYTENWMKWIKLYRQFCGNTTNFQEFETRKSTNQPYAKIKHQRISNSYLTYSYHITGIAMHTNIVCICFISFSLHSLLRWSPRLIYMYVGLICTLVLLVLSKVPIYCKCKPAFLSTALCTDLYFAWLS